MAGRDAGEGAGQGSMKQPTDVIIRVPVSDNIHRAFGFRNGLASDASLLDVQVALEGVVDTFVTDVLDDWYRSTEEDRP